MSLTSMCGDTEGAPVIRSRMRLVAIAAGKSHTPEFEGGYMAETSFEQVTWMVTTALQWTQQVVAAYKNTEGTEENKIAAAHKILFEFIKPVKPEEEQRHFFPADPKLGPPFDSREPPIAPPSRGIVSRRTPNHAAPPRSGPSGTRRSVSPWGKWETGTEET
jgi:hypothetical protein